MDCIDEKNVYREVICLINNPSAHARTLVSHWTVLPSNFPTNFPIGRQICAFKIVQCEISDSRMRTGGFEEKKN